MSIERFKTSTGRDIQVIIDDNTGEILDINYLTFFKRKETMATETFATTSGKTIIVHVDEETGNPLSVGWIGDSTLSINELDDIATFLDELDNDNE
jgi:hypothetical protein